MRLSTQALRKWMLNRPEWNRRVWETGYRGPPLPKKRITGKPPLPIEPIEVQSFRGRLLREWNVMQWLANPYISAEKEAPYLEKHGDIVDQWKDAEVAKKQAKMPSKPKMYKKTDGELQRMRANVGNLLHSHRTVEDQMKNIITGKRWD